MNALLPANAGFSVVSIADDGATVDHDAVVGWAVDTDQPKVRPITAGGDCPQSCFVLQPSGVIHGPDGIYESLDVFVLVMQERRAAAATKPTTEGTA